MIAREAKWYDDDVLPTTRGVLLQRMESVRCKPLLETNATLPHHSMRVLKLPFLNHCVGCRTDFVRIYVAFLDEIEWQRVRGKQYQHIVAFFLRELTDDVFLEESRECGDVARVIVPSINDVQLFPVILKLVFQVLQRFPDVVASRRAGVLWVLREQHESLDFRLGSDAFLQRIVVERESVAESRVEDMRTSFRRDLI